MASRLLALGLVLIVVGAPALGGTTTALRRSRAPEVVVYTTPWCGWCRKTLAYLDDRRVRYVQKDVEGNARNRAELERKIGRISVPVIEIDGRLLRGFDPARIDAALEGER